MTLSLSQQTELFGVERPDGLEVGVDEVGRGPLVGNVVAAAVVLPAESPLLLADSKKLSEKKREALFVAIQEQALAWGIGQASPREIDELNILQATFLAMERAVATLQVPIQKVWVDGHRCPPWHYPSEAVIKGDDKVPAISAASILAKVTRDRQMADLHETYPQYGFDRHKGYPTPAHLQAIKEHGLLAEHYRYSFKPVKHLAGAEQT
ncbi:ribonuclease HII [Thiomicrospira sp. WB1]|uniref:ribonuclease HII n=1 Tax=Thiomicrospira sp. WB1 TaxID=1685380 RepID=UPI00074AD01B|nr:ribonuclease HII [Thiomicrospira sp. WB1]KUJ72095.1 ribonuclease HII [Thiomicrospira sp. WB1]